jgi:hypothetical protein
MRWSAAIPMVLLALPSCKRATVSTPDAAPSASTGSSPTGSAVRTSPADPVPGQYGRFFIDEHRFSAAYPVSPEVKPLAGEMTGVEAHVDDGSAYVVICRPLSPGGSELAHAKEQALGDGVLISESHPPFYSGDAYEVRARLQDHGERFMRFVRFAGRFCSVGAEIVSSSREVEATRFVESFRPEPPPP